jgi:hypothetical protein
VPVRNGHMRIIQQTCSLISTIGKTTITIIALIVLWNIGTKKFNAWQAERRHRAVEIYLQGTLTPEQYSRYISLRDGLVQP